MAVRYICEQCGEAVEAEYEESEGWRLPEGWFQLTEQDDAKAPKHLCSLNCLRGYAVEQMVADG